MSDVCSQMLSLFLLRVETILFEFINIALLLFFVIRCRLGEITWPEITIIDQTYREAVLTIERVSEYKSHSE